MSQLSLEDICLSFCRDTALEILALRQQGGGFLPCLTTKIPRIYSSRFYWYINIIKPLLKQLGYSEQDYVQQLYLEIGNPNHALIPDFMLLPEMHYGHQSALQ